jgi:hypothetical protein
MGQVEQEHMGDISTSGLGDSILHVLAYAPIAHGLEFHKNLCHLGLDLTEQNRLLRISLWYIGGLCFRGSP